MKLQRGVWQMITTRPSLPWQGTMAGFRQFSVDEYHQLIEIGILTEDDNLELLEGYVVHKMSRNPPHDGTIQLVEHGLKPALPSGWCLRLQSAITLSDSEPEPDGAVVRGNARTYLARHPGAVDIGLLIEVSDSTLPGDRLDKGRIYARASVPIYWIINLVDRQIEVYEDPTGPVPNPEYVRKTIYHLNDSIPLVLDGNTVAAFAVQDLLP
jgi:Uma2 family endonuclease